jgi:glycosyltransferase involved in cell wall biosynthesis
MSPPEEGARRVRVAIVADLLEEGWPSMDLMAEMLMAELGRADRPGVEPVLLRPRFASRITPLVQRTNGRPPMTIDRIAHRYWDYPRWLRREARADVYHIVDHSYAHLAADLPVGSVVVTCHDTDAFRTLVRPDRRESSLPRMFVTRVLRGLQRAAVVVCDSQATRAELEAHGLVRPDRLRVVPIGVHPSCRVEPDPAADAAAAALVGEAQGPELLHVGSTIPRKRVETLIDVMARVAEARPEVRLLRVGGPFTAEQEARVDSLGLRARIRVLPFIERPVLAAIYRRSALVLLPSEREGFGLPVIEALACGTPIVASDLAVLREVGGAAAEYCRIDQADEWAARVLALLRERDGRPAAWEARRQAGIARAAQFSWDRCAAEMRDIYARVAAGGADA